MGKKVEIKDNPKQEVVIAVDISDNDINLSNLKLTIKMFKDLTDNYLMNGSVVLFDDEVKFSADVRDYEGIDSKQLKTSEKVNFDNMFNFVKEITEDNPAGIFKVFVLTDNLDKIKNSKDPHIPVNWLTSREKVEVPYGEILKF